ILVQQKLEKIEYRQEPTLYQTNLEQCKEGRKQEANSGRYKTFHEWLLSRMPQDVEQPVGAEDEQITTAAASPSPNKGETHETDQEEALCVHDDNSIVARYIRDSVKYC
ncbi:MAG: hypothetical protein CUN55_21040, partial [Phototrophicales bacterium]